MRSKRCIRDNCRGIATLDQGTNNIAGIVAYCCLADNGGCGKRWLECEAPACGSTRRGTKRKTIFSYAQNAKRHCKRFHGKQKETTASTFYTEEDGTICEVASISSSEAKKTVSQQPGTRGIFGNFMLKNMPGRAVSVLFRRASEKAEVANTKPIDSPNVLAFLYLSKLVVSLGDNGRENLSKLLGILYPKLKLDSSWVHIPTTVSGFSSMLTNITGKHTLVSNLPVPKVHTLACSHGIVRLDDAVQHALLISDLKCSQKERERWQSFAKGTAAIKIIEDAATKNSNVTDTTLTAVVAVTIMWTDGWDSSTSMKKNRNSVHTGTATILLFDLGSRDLLGTQTCLVMAGPGKTDHEDAYRVFLEDLNKFRNSQTGIVMDSRMHKSQVRVYLDVAIVIQDQPERREASKLLGGNSKNHVVFSLSCNFSYLDKPFRACTRCIARNAEYLKQGNWGEKPTTVDCSDCLSWDFGRLVKSKYAAGSVAVPDTVVETDPLYSLFLGPGYLNSSVLRQGWAHTLKMMTKGQGNRTWTETTATAYLSRMCINDQARKDYIETIRNSRLKLDIEENPDDYEDEDLTSIREDIELNPEKYTPMPHPAMWDISDTHYKPQAVMHLSMGVQKAVLKFVIDKWAKASDIGAPFQRRLNRSLEVVQKLHLTYVPCRTFKDEKFGGFTAETHRSLCFLGPWLCRCLTEEGLQLPPVEPPPTTKRIKDYTVKELKSWLKLRGVPFKSNTLKKDLQDLVHEAIEANGGVVPPVTYNHDEQVQTWEVRDLVWRMFNMFSALFCHDLAGVMAKNRATAATRHFLAKMEDLDQRLNPKREHEIWIAKFNFVGLLDVCQSFEHYHQIRTIYEGGAIGEGVVKPCRPLVAKGVHHGWSSNIVKAFYRKETLQCLTDACELDGEVSPEVLEKAGCPLGVNVEQGKFKRYPSVQDLRNDVEKLQPIPICIIYHEESLMAAAVVVTAGEWYLRPIHFLEGGDSLTVDEYGLVYHEVEISDDNEEFMAPDCIRSGEVRVVTYGIMLPDFASKDETTRYAAVNEWWETLNSEGEWTEYSIPG